MFVIPVWLVNLSNDDPQAWGLLIFVGVIMVGATAGRSARELRLGAFFIWMILCQAPILALQYGYLSASGGLDLSNPWGGMWLSVYFGIGFTTLRWHIARGDEAEDGSETIEEPKERRR